MYIDVTLCVCECVQCARFISVLSQCAIQLSNLGVLYKYKMSLDKLILIMIATVLI